MYIKVFVLYTVTYLVYVAVLGKKWFDASLSEDQERG